MSLTAHITSWKLLCGKLGIALGSQLWLQTLCRAYKAEPSLLRKLPTTADQTTIKDIGFPAS